MRKISFCMLHLLFILCSVSKFTIANPSFNIQTHTTIIPHNIECILGVDIGGTNSDFGIFSVKKNKPTLLFSLHTKSQKIFNFTHVVSEVLRYTRDTYNITIDKACFAVAGSISGNNTILPFTVDTKDVCQHTSLTSAYIVGDFMVIGYGIDLIDPRDFICLHEGSPEKYAPRALIGAGTGLGSASVIWNHKIEHYGALPSEGCLLDFAPQTEQEFAFTQFIRQSYRKNDVYWDDILSGRGITTIYNFLQSTNQHHTIMELKNPYPATVFAHTEDPLCKATIDFFLQCYARCTRNIAWYMLPFGGLYIIGGIAAKNTDYFTRPSFINTYLNCESHFRSLLERIPIYLITDYNVSLYGAAQYLLLEENNL